MKALLLLLLPLSAFAGNELGNGRTATGTGNELGNGGDLVAQQFIEGGRELVARLRQYPDSRIPDVDALAKAVERVKVTSAKDLTLHGAEVDAINFPSDDHIDVNRSRWVEAPAEKRASLVLHEYLGILQVPDLHYEISGSYAEAFRPEERSKRVFFEAGSSISTAIPANYRWYKHPGVEMTLAYGLTQRSSVTLRGSYQSFSREEPQASEHTSLTTVATGYKCWLNDSHTFRPFVEAQAGIAIPRYESTWATGLDRFGGTSYSKWDGTDDNKTFLLLGAGGGVRYALSKDFGISGAGYIQNIGLNRSNGSLYDLQFSLGVDVLL